MLATGTFLTFVDILDFTANFLRINIYLTQKISEDMLWNIAVNDAGAAYDPLTLLRTRTLFGRPDFKNIYSRLRMSIESGQYLPGAGSGVKTTVGTYFCGPTPIARVLKEVCKENNNDNVNFTFAKEHF